MESTDTYPIPGRVGVYRLWLDLGEGVRSVGYIYYARQVTQDRSIQQYV